MMRHVPRSHGAVCSRKARGCDAALRARYQFCDFQILFHYGAVVELPWGSRKKHPIIQLIIANIYDSIGSFEQLVERNKMLSNGSAETQ